VILLVKPDKSRYVYLSLPSQTDKVWWEKLAAGAKTPLSKFIIEIVESALSGDLDYKPRGELMKETSAMAQENKELPDELGLKSVVIYRYEEELKRSKCCPLGA
jgi:hypothetical protein